MIPARQLTKRETGIFYAALGLMGTDVDGCLVVLDKNGMFNELL